jgi:glutathione S-transferase
MHSGFGALRSHCPMNIEAALPEVGARMWAEQEGGAPQHGAAGSGLGRRTGAKRRAFPVSATSAPPMPSLRRWCMRLQTYALPVATPRANTWRRWRHPPSRPGWPTRCAEADFLDFEEPYRKHR